MPRLPGDVAESGFDGFRGCAWINVAASSARVRNDLTVRNDQGRNFKSTTGETDRETDLRQVSLAEIVALVETYVVAQMRDHDRQAFHVQN